MRATDSLAPNSETPYLWTFRRCPYAMRARLALDASGVDIEYREILLRDKPDLLRRQSPKATVPVLVASPDHIIDESFDIMLWALEQSDPLQWRSTHPEAHRKTLQWVRRSDTEFKPQLDRYKYANRHPEKSETEFFEEALTFLEALDALLAQRDRDVDDVRLFDAAILPFVRQFRNVNIERFDKTELSYVQSWVDSWLGSASYERIMVKRPLWSGSL